MNDEMRQPTEEELIEELKKIRVQDVLLQTVVTLVNLGGQRVAGEPKDLEQGRLAIDAVRALLPLCPPEQVEPIKNALTQLQMLWAREAQQPSAEPAAGGDPEAAREEQERARAREKLWTPPGT